MGGMVLELNVNAPQTFNYNLLASGGFRPNRREIRGQAAEGCGGNCKVRQPPLKVLVSFAAKVNYPRKTDPPIIHPQYQVNRRHGRHAAGGTGLCSGDPSTS